MKRKLKVRNILILILAVIFIFLVTQIILYLLDTNENNKDTKELIEDVVDKDEETQEINDINFEELLSINSDTIGWIRFNNAKVNNPIVQTEDNDYYLNHSFKKKKNQAGTIFMDYRNKSLNDRNVVIFGHSMPNKTMFGSLKDVNKTNFFEKEDNNYIQIINPNNEIYTYQIFSYYTIKKEEYYITTSFNSDGDFQQFLNRMKDRSKRKFDIQVTAEDKIITLSTCYGSNGTNKRLVVHAKRIINQS